jgi:tetratricopeptide (TPR) repeat protein
LTLADQPSREPTKIPTLKRCVSIVLDDTELLADLAGTYVAEGRVHEAERLYEQALVLDPDYAQVHLELGRLKLGRGAWAKALLHAEAGLRVQPNRVALVKLRDQAIRARKRV